MAETHSRFKVNADLVPLFRGLVTGLQPFALAQDVDLTFISFAKELPVSYNPEDSLLEITTLVTRVVTFTPQTYSVKVLLGKCETQKDHYILTVENSGVDLSKIGEILSSVKNGLRIKRIHQGTQFIVSLPTKPIPESNKYNGKKRPNLPKQYPMYFAEINKRLSSYFSNTENLEEIAELRGKEQGVFLKKVNAIINSHLSDPDFKVDNLASSMALSRTQLFRKIKSLTQMSPQLYIRFVRLEKAKKLLQSKNLNVSEVCYDVGFSSKSHFTRSFKKEFGFNPSELIKGKM